MRGLPAKHKGMRFGRCPRVLVVASLPFPLTPHDGTGPEQIYKILWVLCTNAPSKNIIPVIPEIEQNITIQFCARSIPLIFLFIIVIIVIVVMNLRFLPTTDRKKWKMIVFFYKRWWWCNSSSTLAACCGWMVLGL